MIGYYVHHQGSGHLRRAGAIAAALGEDAVTGLSSLPRPSSWSGQWLQLARDDDFVDVVDETANDRFHWVPRHDPGLRRRMAQLSEWIERARPRVLVVDVSVEVAVLARLHGVPVVTVAMPGIRRDHAHDLGYATADAVIAAWPEWADGMLDTGAELAERFIAVGAISQVELAAGRAPGPIHTIAVLGGTGGGGMTTDDVAAARRQTPGVTWVELGTTRENRIAHPELALQESSLVVAAAGQGAVADIAAVGVPAVLYPEERPFAEQAATARVLSREGSRVPALVLETFADASWPEILAQAATLDGRTWRRWNDGRGAERAAKVIAAVAEESQ